MTFYNTDLQYRVTLDTKLNLFIVFDKKMRIILRLELRSSKLYKN